METVTYFVYETADWKRRIEKAEDLLVHQKPEIVRAVLRTVAGHLYDNLKLLSEWELNLYMDDIFKQQEEEINS